MSTFDHAALTQNINKALKSFRQSQAPVMQGFAQRSPAAPADGASPPAPKGPLPLHNGDTKKCSGCIGFHVQALHKLGATRAELDEMLGLCVYMGGGPALMYCAEAIDAWEKLTVKTA